VAGSCCALSWFPRLARNAGWLALILPATLLNSHPPCRFAPCHPPVQVVTRLGRDTVSVKACLAGRLPSIRRLSACALGRSSLAVLDSMPELRQLCLLEGERRRLELEVHLPQLETCRVEGYQIIKARQRGQGLVGGGTLGDAVCHSRVLCVRAPCWLVGGCRAQPHSPLLVFSMPNWFPLPSGLTLLACSCAYPSA
jgi:hypothetical protein